jgi:uncharacterized SAM-binding protein YcdF (DUF218 family)
MPRAQAPGPHGRHRRARRVAAVLAVIPAAAWLASVSAVVGWGLFDRAAPADAIVVLGAAQYAGRPSPVFRARLDHAIGLWRRGMAPLLIVTGGTGAGDTTSEAAVGRRYAMRLGVPDRAIAIEQQGRTTSESILAVREIMRARRLTSVVLVSDRFHMFRLWLLARRAGLAPLTSPTPSSPIEASVTTGLGYVLSESIKAPAVLVFGLRTN